MKNIETKQIITDTGEQAIGTVATVHNLNDMNQGVAEDERIGDTVRARMLEIKYEITGSINPVNVIPLHRIRVFIYWMATPSQAVSLPTQVSQGLWNFPLNPNVFVMYDRVHFIQPRLLLQVASSTTLIQSKGNATSTVRRHLRFNLKNRRMHYTTAGGVIPVKGRIQMAIISMTAVASPSPPTFAMNWRLYYKDA